MVWVAGLTFASVWAPLHAAAQDILSGSITLEARGFPREALLPEQPDATLSLSGEPEIYLTWGDGVQSLTFTPFFRLDSSDGERTHLDIRELFWQIYGDSWEVRAGLGKVFWGVTESQHLVDVINQTDLVESPDGEDKLGQPMVNLTLLRSWGTVDLFVLPGFRERTFVGSDGRLALPLPVDDDNEVVERDVGYAARWFHTLGDIDLGVSHFWGSSRDPRFLITADDGAPALLPIYETIHQTSLDLQLTTGNWAWKLEALTRSGQGDRFYASVGGFEYTIGNIRRSGADLGLLAELNLDSRDDIQFGDQQVSATPFDQDLFVGSRLALNDVQDTQLLGGAVVDLGMGAVALFLETSRRLGDVWTADFEVRGFVNTDPSGPLYGVRRDSYGQFSLHYHF